MRIKESKMYKGHSIWDEEQEKYDNIIVDRDENKPEYHNKRDYASGSADQSDVYSTEKGEEEKKKGDKSTGIERDVMKEEKKYEKKEEVSEEGIKRKAASKVHQEGKSESTESKKKKKEYKSIEDAINKAMKEEKEVIYIHE